MNTPTPFRHNAALALILWVCLASAGMAQGIIGGGFPMGGGGGNPDKYSPSVRLRVGTGVYTDAAVHFVAADTADLQANNAATVQVTTTFLWAAWLRFDTDDALQVVVCKGALNDSNTEYCIFRGSNNKLNFAIGNGSTSTSIYSSALSGATWYFVAAWYDAATETIKLQLDDGTPVSGDWTGGTQQNATKLFIGSNVGASMFLGARLDSLMLFKPSASDIPAIVTAMYNSGDGVLASDITASQRTTWGATCAWDVGEAAGSNRVDSWASVALAETGGTIARNGGVPRGVAAVDDMVSYWAGVGNDASQTVFAKRPTYAVTAVTADGVDDLLAVGDIGLGASDMTVFVVCDPTAAAGTDEEILGDDDFALCHLTDSAGKVGLYNDGGYISVADATADLQVLCWSLNSTGTNGELFRNGSKIGSSFAYVQADLDAVNLLSDSAGTGAFYDGTMRDIAIFPTVLGAAARGAITSYYLNAYGITP